MLYFSLSRLYLVHVYGHSQFPSPAGSPKKLVLLAEMDSGRPVYFTSYDVRMMPVHSHMQGFFSLTDVLKSTFLTLY